MHLMSRVFSNTTSLMTSVCMLYVGTMAASNVFLEHKWPPFFANYSLMVILIEKIIREMNLDIHRVIEFIFST